MNNEFIQSSFRKVDARNLFLKLMNNEKYSRKVTYTEEEAKLPIISWSTDLKSLKVILKLGK